MANASTLAAPPVPRLPPGPRGNSLLLSLRYLRDPLGLFEECQARYGPYFTMRLPGFGTWVFLTRPEDVQMLYTTSPDVLVAGEANGRVLAPMTGWNASVTLDGAAFKRRRKVIMPSFHGDRMRNYADTMRAVAEESIRSWPIGTPFAIHPVMQDVTLDVIFRTIFGLDERPEHHRLRNLLYRCANEAACSKLLLAPYLQWDLGRFSPWGKIQRLVKDTDDLLLREIERRRSGNLESDDVLTHLLKARHEDGSPMSSLELRDELITLPIAGHETTGTSLAWAIERILSEPAVLRRLREEIEEVLGDEPIDQTHVPRLRYLDCVLKEALRYRPVIPNASVRIVRGEVDLGEYRIPEGTCLTNCLYLLHRQPDLYPDPERFDPMRFWDWSPAHYEWCPFGGGPRICPGMAFALYEMKIVLATVFQRVRLEPVATDLRPVRRGYFLAPEKGMVVTRTA